MPMLSVRVTKEELEVIRRARIERGCASTSQYIRRSMGFDPGEPTPVDMDEIDGLASIAKLMVNVVEREDEAIRLLRKMARSLGLRSVIKDDDESIPEPADPVRVPKEPVAGFTR